MKKTPQLHGVEDSSRKSLIALRYLNGACYLPCVLYILTKTVTSVAPLRDGARVSSTTTLERPTSKTHITMPKSQGVPSSHRETRHLVYIRPVGFRSGGSRRDIAWGKGAISLERHIYIYILYGCPTCRHNTDVLSRTSSKWKRWAVVRLESRAGARSCPSQLPTNSYRGAL